MISNAQKAMLHVAKSQLKLEDEMYRAILREQGGVESSTELTNTTFERVIRRLEELGFVNSARRPLRRDRRPTEPVTPEQQQKIRDLYATLGWTETARQMGFNKRCCRKSWPQTRTDAAKVIEGLKAIVARRVE